MTTTDPEILGAAASSQLPAQMPLPLRILAMALPLMAGSLAGAGLHVAKTTMLTYQGDSNALFTLSMVQPAFIFMLAFLESLAITNQVFSSKSVNGWARGDVLRATAIFSRIGVAIALLLAAIFWLVAPFTASFWAIGPQILPQMSLFVMSMVPYLLFEMRNGALRGQGRTGIAFATYLVLIVVDVTATWVAITQFNLGFAAVLLGNSIGPLVALPMGAIYLRRQIGTAAVGPNKDFRKHMIGLTIGVTGPVFASMLAGSASAAVIFPAMAALGENISSAFLIVVRLRIIFIIPAVSLGSAIAIIVNQMPETGHNAERRRTLLVGAVMVLGLYGLALLALHAWTAQVVGNIVPAENLRLASEVLNLVTALLPTFYLIATFTMFQVILEHLGLGLRVLVVTAVSELATIVWCLQALDAGLPGLVLAMNGLAAATFGLMLVMFLLALGRPVALQAQAKQEDRDAV
jgi:Na+-driven multidrug efflux pump